MGHYYESMVRPWLFRQDSERAHEMGVRGMAALGAFAPLRRALEWWHRPGSARTRPVEAFGLQFPNAIGLAAGMDKNAVALPAWPLLGFGHIEIGSVTALAQPGNPQPRIFRLPRQRALINRLGFNNQGAEAIAARLV